MHAVPLNYRHMPLDLIATTAFGLESVTVRELEWLGIEAKPISTGRVLFQGDGATVALTNLHLRTADRVLIRVATFPAKDFDQLFEGVKALPWEQWISRDAAFPVNGRSVKSQLSSVPAVQRATKRAIVDRLMHTHRTTTLPETEQPVVIEVGLLNDVCTLTIDTSGPGLHKRGYRPLVGDAALKETMAAGLVMLSTWRPRWPLVDPFCGSGTIAIEAAMLARNIAPGINRGFDAEKWPTFREQFGAKVFEEAREAARANATGKVDYTIHASDIDDRALGLARQAAKTAGVDRDIHFKKQAFAEISSKAEYGSIITNPPYGVRLGEAEEIERLYRSMPLVLRNLPSWSFFILSARTDLEYIVGQEATRRRKLYNSQIECTYFSFLGPKPPRDDARPPRSQDAAGAEPSQPQRETQPATASSVPDAIHAPAPDEAADSTESQQTEPPSSSQPFPERFAPKTERTKQVNQQPANAPAFCGLRERDLREAQEFGNCLAKNVRHLRKWPSRGITCYRLYERDYPDVPLIIDRYEDRIHVAEYEREHSRTFAQQADWYDLMRKTISEVCETPLEHVYMKAKHRQRGLTQHEKVDASKHTIVAQEAGLKFEVNLSDYIDTGLFIDHRQTRSMVRDLAQGKRFLNLFCYTGSFTVYAAAGGARSSVSVDLSNTYLDWLERNLALNGLRKPQHEVVRSDVLEFLRQHPRPRSNEERYDLVVCDPPTFSNSKSTEDDWEVASQHVDVFDALRPLLSQGAVTFFSNNYRRFKLNEEALAKMGYSFIEISKRTVPPDYRNERIHRCWKVTFGAPVPAAAPR